MKFRLLFEVARALSVVGVLCWESNAYCADQPNAKKIEMQCGMHRVQISCGKQVDPEYPEDERQCNHNTLKFVDRNGGILTPPVPKTFDETKTPVAMGCERSRETGDYFVTVLFSNGPNDCLHCITYNLFAEDGIRLTAESTDNNSKRAKLSKKLELEKIGKWLEIEPNPQLINYR